MPLVYQKNRPVVFFDGVCVLCNAAVKFIIRNDPDAYFSFASLQSDFAEDLLKKKGIDAGQLDSLILIENDQVFSKSTAVLKICSHLRFPWNLLVVLRLVPPVLRDLLYSLTARVRYRCWGRLDQCSVPDASVRERFLS